MAVETYTDINALPEDCIANVLSLTNPKDACRLSLVASTFRSASRSDAVWTRFLPSDYRDIICRAIDGHDSLLANIGSKKDLYLHLCDNPILIDGGRKSFSLEKLSGKKCYVLAPRELFIVWGHTIQYWQWISLPGYRRFSEVAELLKVCWLEIRGRISLKMLSPNTNYAAYFVFSCKSNMYGFNHEPAEGFVGPVGHGGEKRTICLDPDEANRERHQIVQGRMGLSHHRLQRHEQDENVVGTESNVEYPKRRDDGWMEVELGEYFVKGDEEDEDGDLEMSLLEVKGGNWKRGLVVQGIEIRPKYQN